MNEPENDLGPSHEAGGAAGNSPRRLVVILQQEGPRQAAGKWEAIERASKVLSIAAIPVVLAIGGAWLQGRLQAQSVSREYVQLAVSILQEPDQRKVVPSLRAWAVDLLNDNSPTKLSEPAADELRSGRSTLPSRDSVGASARPLSSLNPAVAELARQLVAKANALGMEVLIFKTLLTDQEQEELRSKGLTAAHGGQSMHNLGLAFDIVPVINGKPTFGASKEFEQLGALGKSLGLTWGGDWKPFKDYPHFEWRPPLNEKP